MLLTYIGTNGATVTYSIDNADKTEHTAATGTGVTALKVGATYTVYGVTVASRPKGGTVHWYEGGVYQASESLPDDVLTPLAVVDANVDAILEDTGTTLPAAVAAIPTNPLLTNDVRLDAVADIDEMLTFLTAYFSNRLTTTTNAGVRTVTLYDTDGTTPLKTWTYTVATNERSAGA